MIGNNTVDNTHSIRETALVTGASIGIGREMCYLFAEEGIDNVIIARRIDLLQSL